MDSIKRERNSGVDLLRIIAMIMVVVLHVINQGGVLNAAADNVANYLISSFFVAAAYGAVNCYALVSGYVGMDSKHKYTSIMQLFLQVIFYTLLVTAMFYFLNPDKYGIWSFKSALFPVSNESYWYFTAYFGMFFFAPFFNKMLNCLSKKEAKTLAISIIMVLSVIPCVFRKDVFKSEWGYSMLWLSALYLLGGCIKITEFEKKLKQVSAFLIFILCIIITYLSTFLPGINKYTFLLTYTSPTVLISAVALLIWFSQLKINGGFKKLIAFFSPLAFGVYLIHTEPHIWNEVLLGRFASFAKLNSVMLVIAITGTVFVIWFVCSMIDFVRLSIFKLLHIRGMCVAIENRLKKLFD